MDISSYMQKLGQSARAAASVVALAETQQKNQALLFVADAIEQARSELLKANQKDLITGQEKGLDAALIDRLELTDARIDGMIKGLQEVASLPRAIRSDWYYL